MALKVLLMRSRLDGKNKKLEELRARDADFEKREEELEKAISEMTEETTEEDRKVVEGKVEELEKEKTEHEKEKKDLEEEIGQIEKDIEEEEKKQEEARDRGREPKNNERDRRIAEMANRTRFFNMDIQERNAFFADEGVKDFLGQVRSCIREKRALTNVGLTIPEIMLPLIRQKIEQFSKLIGRVTVHRVGGSTRQNIMGEIPEAYWDEMCASLKELDLAFYNMEMDGYKVSGFFAVCNAVYEDSDINLAEELINAISKAIGKALDKAILYGKDVKMPMGIVTSLMKAEQPEGYPTTGRKWEDLSTSHVITIENTEGLALFKEIVENSGIVDNDYETGEITWVMNKKTHTRLLAESMERNSAAAIVAGMNTMPVIGGEIVEFKYIPDDTIIFGYFANYALAERAGVKLGQSEHVRFIEDQVVFRGTARYDGDLVIREAFGILGIGAAPTTTAPKFAGEE